jgi:preprotein translocase subunit SecA
MRHESIDEIVAKHIPEKAYAEQWDVEGMAEEVKAVLNLDLPVADWAAEEGIADAEIRERLGEKADAMMAKKTARFSADLMRRVEKQMVLQMLDHLWREHLAQLDALRSVVGFRGYAQRDPLNEYKTESFEMFQTMLASLRRAVTGQLAHVELVEPEPLPPALPEGAQAHHLDPLTGEDEVELAAQSGSRPRAAGPAAAGGLALAERDPGDPASWGKVGRNEACPCGSGKKYKHCHGKVN